MKDFILSDCWDLEDGVMYFHEKDVRKFIKLLIKEAKGGKISLEDLGKYAGADLI